jgi:hypothetical protein
MMVWPIATAASGRALAKIERRLNAVRKLSLTTRLTTNARASSANAVAVGNRPG